MGDKMPFVVHSPPHDSGGQFYEALQTLNNLVTLRTNLISINSLAGLKDIGTIILHHLQILRASNRTSLDYDAIVEVERLSHLVNRISKGTCDIQYNLNKYDLNFTEHLDWGHVLLDIIESKLETLKAKTWQQSSDTTDIVRRLVAVAKIIPRSSIMEVIAAMLKGMADAVTPNSQLNTPSFAMSSTIGVLTSGSIDGPDILDSRKTSGLGGHHTIEANGAVSDVNEADPGTNEEKTVVDEADFGNGRNSWVTLSMSEDVWIVEEALESLEIENEHLRISLEDAADSKAQALSEKEVTIQCLEDQLEDTQGALKACHISKSSLASELVAAENSNTLLMTDTEKLHNTLEEINHEKKTMADLIEHLTTRNAVLYKELVSLKGHHKQLKESGTMIMEAKSESSTQANVVKSNAAHKNRKTRSILHNTALNREDASLNSHLKHLKQPEKADMDTKSEGLTQPGLVKSDAAHKTRKSHNFYELLGGESPTRESPKTKLSTQPHLVKADVADKLNETSNVFELLVNNPPKRGTPSGVTPQLRLAFDMLTGKVPTDTPPKTVPV